MDIKAPQPVSSVSAVPAVPGTQPSSVEAPDGASTQLPRDRPVAAASQDARQRQVAVAEQLQRLLKSADRQLEFTVDGEAEATVITVRDAATGDVIRQIPSEEALRIMRYLNAQSGTLLDLTA